MYQMRMITIIISTLSLFCGGALYLLFRSERLLMFEWLGELRPFVLSIRPKCVLYDWLIYSLPDGLWLFSYVILIGAIWSFNMKGCILYSMPLIVIALGSELLQVTGLVPGTFDWVDLLCYSLGAICGFYYINLLKSKINYEYEKSI